MLTRFCSNEACGKTIPCRIGTRRLAEIVARREDGLVRPTDLQLATDLAARHRRSALCDHERLATLPLTSGMRYFAVRLRPSCQPCPAGARPTRPPDDRPLLDPSPTAARSQRRAAAHDHRRLARRAPARHAVAAAPAVDAAHPHRGRRPRRRGLRGPDDPRGLPRQRHRDPDPLLRAQAARLRRLPDVRRRGRGRGASADLVLAHVRGRDEGPDPDRGGPPAAADEPRADLQRPQRLLPAAVPEQVPQPHRHPGLPQGQRRGATSASRPGSSSGRSRSRSVLGRVCPAPCEEHCRRDEVDEAIAIRDTPPLRRRPGHQVDARRRRRPAGPVRAPGPDRPPGRGHRLRAGRHGRRVLPAPRRPRRHRLRARPGARRDAPLRHPAVPPAEGRGPRGRVRVGHPARRQDGLQRRASAATSRSTT